ncbi:MAG: magnesium transporter [Candidatus Aenigmarchaeota archaeon]|nr:magnesium transporter [Candidatus Aenigmarchaeota archaeon]
MARRRPGKSRARSRRSDFREILFANIFSVTGGLFAGSLLSFAIDKAYLIPGLFILLPGFLEMRGSISGSLSARLSSGLWLEAMRPQVKGNRILRGNVMAALLLAVCVSLVLGGAAFLLSWLVFGKAITAIILVALIAGLLSNVIEIPATVMTTFWLFRRGEDPNNIMGPYVTTLGDVVSIFSLLLAMVVV